jgi:uncharacterized membrane protein (UPF0127 family)
MIDMDVEEVRKKLREKQEGQQTVVTFSEKEHKKTIAISIAVVVIVVIALLGTWSLLTTPKEIVGNPQACFKTEECLEIIFAMTPEEQETGYSNYTAYPSGKAMLFVFDKVGMQSMWMKDMAFPIDIIWIDSRDRIGHIVKEAPPCEDKTCLIYEPPIQAKYVLEVPSGFARENNLFNGDVIEFENMPDDFK